MLFTCIRSTAVWFVKVVFSNSLDDGEFTALGSFAGDFVGCHRIDYTVISRRQFVAGWRRFRFHDCRAFHTYENIMDNAVVMPRYPFSIIERQNLNPQTRDLSNKLSSGNRVW